MTMPDDAELHAYVDGRLKPADRARIEHALEADPAAAARVAAWQADTNLLRRALARKAQEPVPARFDLRRLRPIARRPTHAAIAASVAAALLLGGVAGWWAHGAGVRTGLDGLSDQAVLSERVLGRTLFEAELVATRQSVGQNGPVPARTIDAPDLRGDGYALLGSRVVATEQGTAVLFVYGDGARRVGLFVRLMIGVDETIPLRPVSAGPVGGFAWSRDGIGYGLIGAEDTPGLRRLAEAAQAATTRDR